ncbi:MAG: hypothetical protein HGA80_02200 [Candidatus Omnitrophica bacterium]|nr:hypothetical protein [Candidatus Omnitrophota bacterium]
MVLNFQKSCKLPASFTVDVVPLLNVLLLVSIFYMLSNYFTRPFPISVKLPGAVTSDVVQDKLTIMITSENIIYYNNKVTTLRELRELLSQTDRDRCSVFIKADRRASVGRIVDVWDLGRALGIKSIDVATD